MAKRQIIRDKQVKHYVDEKIRLKANYFLENTVETIVSNKQTLNTVTWIRGCLELETWNMVTKYTHDCTMQVFCKIAA